MHIKEAEHHALFSSGLLLVMPSLSVLAEFILSDGDEYVFDQCDFYLTFFAGANSLVRSGLCEEGQLFTVELLQGFVRSIKKSDVHQPMSQIIQLLGPELGFKRQR